MRFVADGPFDRLTPILRHQDGVPSLLQQVDHEFPIDRVILGDKNAERRVFGGSRRFLDHAIRCDGRVRPCAKIQRPVIQRG